jgi:hypothetical protein
MDEEDKSVKSIPFSGKKEDYQIWRAKLLSYAQVKGCKAIMVEDGKCPDSKEDLVSAAVNTTDALKAANKEKLRLRRANDLAYSMLTICVKDPVSFGAVYNAISTYLPDGNAALALANLDTI